MILRGKYIDGLKAAEYTTLFRRVRRLNILIPENRIENLVIAIDSSGIKVTNRGEWLREKWKVHIAVDVNAKKIVAIKVTDEKVADSRVFSELISQAEKSERLRRLSPTACFL